jgi:GT2 family glycosyltransferase
MNENSSNITVSVVSHGHGDMVWTLISQVLKCNEVKKVIVTLNIPEAIPNYLPENVLLIKNDKPKGFGENHNFAFTISSSDYFCVLNPDIVLVENPFQSLKNIIANDWCGLVAPVIIDVNGIRSDSMRKDLTPWSIFNRVLGFCQNTHSPVNSSELLFPDWVAGMFMLFRSQAFNKVCGFDTGYFMYCEDADISRRLRNSGYQIVGCPDVTVIHDARRASRRNFQHLLWHVQSLCKYFIKHR